MDPVLTALEFTLGLVLRTGSIMFVSLFGIELLMQMGVMRRLGPLGRPVARAARLPAESAVSFLTALGSMVAAHAMAAGFHADGRLSDRELRLTGVLNTVPFHVKETLTFQLPVVLPLLGFRLAMIYIAAFWLTGILKLGFVMGWGRLGPAPQSRAGDAFQTFECAPDDPACRNRGILTLLRDAWNARKKMYVKMMGLLAAVTFIVQVLALTGMLSWMERGIAPMTSALNLPASVIGPLTTYVFSPTAGIAFMSNLMGQGQISGYEAICALMAGGLLMIPFTRVRRTLPRYTAIFGIKNGAVICAMTMAFAMLSRVLVLAWILLFFR